MKTETFRARESDYLTTQKSRTKTGNKSRCSSQKLIIFVSIIFGILVTVAVIFIPIYVTQTIASQNTNSSNGTYIPPQCSNYTNDTDATRLTTYSATTTGCDSSYSTPKWVRFTGGGATQMVTSVPPANRCGTSGTGWFVSPLPSTVGATTAGLVCYNWSNNPCSTWNWIQVTNCSGFYIYLLTNAPACSYRYCTQ